MQLLKSKGVINGFRAIELDDLVQEVVELGEHWEPPRFTEELHHHEYWELSYISEGAVELEIASRRTCLLSAGCFWSIPEGTLHCFRLGDDARHHRKFLGLKLSTVAARHPEWNCHRIFSRPLVLFDVHHFEQAFSRLVVEGTRPLPHQVDALRLALDLLLLEVVRQTLGSDQRTSSAVAHPGVSRVLNVLQTRFREHWTLEKLADEAGVSRARLAELFRQQVGAPIHKTLNRIRIEYAQMLLETSDLNIRAISQECGFATSQHFARIFREVMGTTAQEYRRALPPPALAEILGSFKANGSPQNANPKLRLNAPKESFLPGAGLTP
jgi:AraC family transcriptional regulator